MPYTYETDYTIDKLTPLYDMAGSKTFAASWQANQTVLRGQPVARASVAVNAVQTLTVTGTPTGGTFKLQFLGIRTAALAYDSSAAEVQAALEAIISVGAGNVSCSGGDLPGTPVVITAAGDLAGKPLALITVVEAAFTGGTDPAAAVAHTTVGAIAGGMRAWTGSLLSRPGVPTVSAVAGGTGFGDGTNSMPYTVTVTFYNDSGETLPSQAATVLVTSTNRTIRVGAYNGVNANVAGARYYVNGNLAGTTAKSSGNIAQTDLTAFTAANVPQPTEATAYATQDGSGRMVGLAPFDITTDEQGRVLLPEHGGTLPDAPYWGEGYFRMGDLQGIDSTNGPQLEKFGRFLSGDYTDPEAVFRLN